MQPAVVGRTYATYGRNRLNIREYSRIFANIGQILEWFCQCSRILPHLETSPARLETGWC
eukprot:4452613-Prymnesium_polylepis.1